MRDDIIVSVVPAKAGTHFKVPSVLSSPVIFWGIMTALALFLMLSKEGIVYLTENQADYFIYGLRLSDPHFIPNDWFTWKVFHHHFAFGYLIWFLQTLGSLSITTVLTDLLLMTGMTYGLFLLCRRFSRYPWMVFICLVTWLGIVGLHETELGKEYLFDGFLQPAELSGCLMVLGVALLFERRFLFSGCILGIAGLFHAAILVSIAPVLTAMAFYMKIWQDRRAFLSFVLPLILLWGFSYLVLKMTFSHSSFPIQDALSILINLRDPLLRASNWSVFWTVNWFLWILLGGMVILTRPWDQKFNEWRICFVAVILTSIVGMLQSAFINIPSLTVLMLWRSSPLAIILSLVLVIDQCLHWVMSPGEIKRRDMVLISGMVLVMFIFLHYRWSFHNPRRFLWLMSYPLAALTGWIFYIFTRNITLRLTMAGLIIVSIMGFDMARVGYQGIAMSRNNETNPEEPSLGEMEQWVRKNTPQNAIFIVHPEMEYMRVRARRAIVVDWKPPCYLPSDLQEWYHRLCLQAGLAFKPMVRDENTIIKGYDQMDTRRALALKKMYGARYLIVIKKEHTGNLNGLKELFANADYRVLEIP